MQAALNHQEVTSVRYGKFRQQHDAMQTSETLFFSFFEQYPLPMGLCRVEDSFATSFWNQAWFELMGFDPQYAQGKTGRELSFWAHPEDREYVVARLRAGEDLKDVEFEMRNCDGNRLFIAVSARKIVEPESLVLVSFIDVTARCLSQHEVALLNSELEIRVKERTHELQQANQELSKTLLGLQRAQARRVHIEKLSALGALVAGVAHTLNTPIGNSLMMASTIEDTMKSFDCARDAGLRRSDVQNLVDDVTAAAGLLVHNLVSASNIIDTFKHAAVIKGLSERQTFSLSDVVQQVVARRIALLHKRQLRLSSDVSDEFIIHSHPESFALVLGQLIDNAILHGYEHDQSGSISVKVRRNNDQLIAVISDDGCGIVPENINHVFEPFFTTRFGQGGSGLGLYTAHRIVTAVLNGEIEIHSDAGQGTQVKITLPFVSPILSINQCQ